MAGHALPVEIDVGSFKVFALAFSANGECLVSGGSGGVRVWRVRDGKQVAALEAQGAPVCLAASRDGRWIAAGTYWGHTYVWNAQTYEQVFKRQEDDSEINGVDFSPDSTRLVVASDNYTATVWDVAARQRALAFRHDDSVTAAKHSPQGDRIATATKDSVRVWGSNDGRLLVDVKITVTPWYNTGLLWSNDHWLFVVSGDKIKPVEAFTGAVLPDWRVPNADHCSSISLSRYGNFIAYAANDTVTLWNTPTHTNLAFVQHTQYIRSIALSPDDQFLAIGGVPGKIAIKCLSYYFMPFINISDTTFGSWMHGRLADTEGLLTETIARSTQPSHQDLASRALVRAHLGRWDVAIGDAENSINVQPSVIGYIAKSITLIGGGKKMDGFNVFDLAFKHCDPVDVDLLLLIKAIIFFIAGERDAAVSRVGHLIATTRLDSMCYMIQACAYMHLLIGKSHMTKGDFAGGVRSLERARDQMRPYVGPPLLSISLVCGWKFDRLGITIRQRLCEAMCAAGRTREACESLLEFVNTFDQEVYMSVPDTKWVSDFTQRCLASHVSPTVAQHDQTPIAPDSSTPTPLLREWAKSTLTIGGWKDALTATINFTIPRVVIYRALCEHLETIDHMTDAGECFRQLVDELGKQKTTHSEEVQWVIEKLEDRGNDATSAKLYDDAISEYSAALSFSPATPQDLLIKRSKAHEAKGSWKDALDDANRVIALDPSSPWGYERKHAALHKGRDYENAIDAFAAMLSKMSDSPDPDIREHRRLYINPEDIKVVIRSAVLDTIHTLPPMLINTTSGRLCNKSEQAAAFESLPVFMELISSMTTLIDRARIEEEVRKYYRYGTFSHKWDENEPLFEKVVNIVVFDLDKSLTHDKLRMFCEVVRDAGFHWAWSDTCCINKSDHFILQEALVSMFKWYEGSAVTIVFLRGVRSPSRRGDLVKSVWNTRGWTFQEYHASKVVRFYTEDWKPYANIDIPNHKESPEILSEMEKATGIPAQDLMALRPGLDDIRQKLRLASRRKTSYVEDAAYSLFGIFTVSLPVVYGEGNKALGRLLAQLLTCSGDTSILAWTGKPGKFNTCLPADIVVFDELPTSHIPEAIGTIEMDRITAGLRASTLNLQLAMKLYDRLIELPIPSFAGQRMRIPCITFKLGPLAVSRDPSELVFRAQTAALGVVSIRTKKDLNLFQFDSLYLIHPWIDFLLDRQPVGSVGVTETILEEGFDDQYFTIAELPSTAGPSGTALVASQRRPGRLLSRLGRPFGGRSTTNPGDVGSLRPPSSLSHADKEMRALQLMARLRRPFGALLLTPARQNAAEYRRVASESMIIVQIQEEALSRLNVLMDNARMLDVL